MTDILDDPSNLRALYGVIEPCFRSDGTVDPVCTTIASGSNIATGAPAASNLGDATSAGIDLTASPNLKGWWIMLDGCKDSNLAPVDCTVSGVDNPAAVFKAERVVTEPLAATSGAVFFSTITPTADPCEYGGRSFLWAVRFDTGGTLVPFGILKGKAIIQRSTGEIEQIDLATAFTTAGGGQAGQRKTTASFGLTGSGGISIIVPPKPLNQILHIKKR
jgi:type IV pilus assembly protein PilY1